MCVLSVLSVDRDADTDVKNGIRIGWNKFRHLVPLFTNKDIPLTVMRYERGYLSGVWCE